jgi:hypothetical protein
MVTRFAGTVAMSAPSVARGIGWESALTTVDEPPALLLHRFDRNGLVTSTVSVGSFDRYTVRDLMVLDGPVEVDDPEDGFDADLG